jgi:murein DD-endopeptidase MepM/ murein hydrolase activator NlpD
VNVDAMAEAIASIESSGGDYMAVGTPTCDADGLCGRAIGKYQTMSYKESVQAAVGQKSGGTAWLTSVSTGHVPTEQEIMTYYPPEMQEQVYQTELRQLTQWAAQETDPKTGQAFTGERLVERVAQMWYAGPNSTIDSQRTDSHRRLTTYEYGTEARQYYASVAGKAVRCTTAVQGDGKASGTLKSPVPGAPLTSGYGWRIHPNTGQERLHAGVDLALNSGDPVYAADGGQVDAVNYDAGYGNYVIVDHGNGTATLYAHLESSDVTPGQRVSQGQAIAKGDTTGLSTGPHLHFEVIEGYRSGDIYSGYAIDPEQAVNF